jgi:hypothetical protein
MVSSLATIVTSRDSNSNPALSLQNYYQSEIAASTQPSTSTSPSGPRKFGTNPEDLPQMDLLSPSIRESIIEGKDVNLASLLIPYYELETKDKEDSRLKKSLPIS